jgi:DNA-binding NarL/FixJ family response regulator
LQPDVILLDIGLPLLNGIEAARQLAKVGSAARIIFLTQESSAEVVHEALALGAWGYVIKAQAGNELIAAVEAVAQGGTFVSCGLNGNARAGVR